MWIVDASNLSPSDLALLGNNVRPAVRRRYVRPRYRRDERRRADRRLIAAVNRSLASLRERVARLYPCRVGNGAAGGGARGAGRDIVRLPVC